MVAQPVLAGSVPRRVVAAVFRAGAAREARARWERWVREEDVVLEAVPARRVVLRPAVVFVTALTRALVRREVRLPVGLDFATFPPARAEALEEGVRVWDLRALVFLAVVVRVRLGLVRRVWAMDSTPFTVVVFARGSGSTACAVV